MYLDTTPAFNYLFVVLLTNRAGNEQSVLRPNDRKSEFGFLQEQDFSTFHVVETGFEAHPTSCPIGTEISFPGINLLGKKLITPPTSAKAKKT
jgi:hypothetical protein